MRQLARKALKSVCSAVDLLARPGPGVTVLIYHRVGGGTLGQVDLDPAVFDAQMAELAEAEAVISLTDAVAALGSPTSPPAQHQTGPPAPSQVVITFDDGTPDFVENAVPILAKYQLPATLYLATAFVEDSIGFWDPADRPLTWDEIGEALSTGLIEVGSHTHTHAVLSRLSGPETARELDRSIGLIGDRLGVRADHFAYPKAVAPNPAAEAEVRARFESAAVAGTRANPWSGTDLYRLARSPIQRSDAMRWFRQKAAGGLHAEDRVRDLVNRRSYAQAAN